MASLADKLKSLGVQHGARNLAQPPRRLADPHPIEAVVSGAFQATLHGDIFTVEQSYPKGYQHGRVGVWGEISRQEIAGWAQDVRIAECSLEQFTFLDTETTGLAGGTGTYAFLIGVGRFEGGTFRVAQFFMRDPGEERAILSALAEFLAPCQTLVTFNGKSFDAPLLNARYIVNGEEPPLAELAHLDLLALARRLWPERLASRRLIDLEIDILEMVRTEEDVPGWAIPSMYFDYLRSGDARPLGRIFYHNAMDIAAMAALLNQMARMLADPLGEAIEHALDLIALGKLYEGLSQFDLAEQLFSEGMRRQDLPEEHYWEAQRRLSFLYKRQERLAAAVEVWQLAAAGGQIYAHVELAKFYEHRQRDYGQALIWTEAALDLLSQSGASGQERRAWLGDLRHRLARLKRKVG